MKKQVLFIIALCFAVNIVKCQNGDQYPYYQQAAQYNNQQNQQSQPSNYQQNNQFYNPQNYYQEANFPPNNNQQNNYYLQQNINKPINNRYQSEDNSYTSNERLSARECRKFKNIVNKKFGVATLAIGSQKKDIEVTDCDVSKGLIVGGVVTKKGEFPHMAAIGYKWKLESTQIEFRCGGSLISASFVLTAAHCSNKRLIPVLVRLGDHNIVTRSDDLLEVDIPVAEFIKHENYNRRTKHNDIALIKLAHPVSKFTKFIRPACLWQTDDINITTTIASGWGLTEEAGQKSDELMKVELDIIDTNHCSYLLKDQNYNVSQQQLCAGVLTGGKDTCQGDSGGPIQVTTSHDKCVYHIIGVTSFGNVCGGVNTPSLYTRVSSYLDWIEEKVWR